MVTRATHTSAKQRRQPEAINAKLAVLAKRKEHPRIQALRQSLLGTTATAHEQHDHDDSAATATTEHHDHEEEHHDEHQEDHHENHHETPTSVAPSTTPGTVAVTTSAVTSKSSGPVNPTLTDAHIQAAAQIAAASGLSASDLEELSEYTFSTFGFVPPEVCSLTLVLPICQIASLPAYLQRRLLTCRLRFAMIAINQVCHLANQSLRFISADLSHPLSSPRVCGAACVHM